MAEGVPNVAFPVLARSNCVDRWFYTRLTEFLHRRVEVHSLVDEVRLEGGACSCMVGRSHGGPVGEHGGCTVVHTQGRGGGARCGGQHDPETRSGSRRKTFEEKEPTSQKPKNLDSKLEPALRGPYFFNIDNPKIVKIHTAGTGSGEPCTDPTLHFHQQFTVKLLD